MQSRLLERRLLAGIVGLALTVEGLQFVHRVREPMRAAYGDDVVTRYWRRFDRAREALAAAAREARAGYLRVGYVGDAPRPDQMPYLGRDRWTGLFLAQHALLPHVLVEGGRETLLVTNWHGEQPPPPDGFVRAGDFGDGVAVFRRLP